MWVLLSEKNEIGFKSLKDTEIFIDEKEKNGSNTVIVKNSRESSIRIWNPIWRIIYLVLIRSLAELLITAN